METDKQKAETAKRAAIAAVSRWRDAILESQQWKANYWAKLAGISPTTITRSMEPNSASSSKLETLHLLARAAGVPSVIDLLDHQAIGPKRDLPSAPALTEMFAGLLKELGLDPYEDERAAKLARSLPGGLEAAALHRVSAGSERPSIRAKRPRAADEDPPSKAQ